MSRKRTLVTTAAFIVLLFGLVTAMEYHRSEGHTTELQSQALPRMPSSARKKKVKRFDDILDEIKI